MGQRALNRSRDPGLLCPTRVSPAPSGGAGLRESLLMSRLWQGDGGERPRSCLGDSSPCLLDSVSPALSQKLRCLVVC